MFHKYPFATVDDVQRFVLFLQEEHSDILHSILIESDAAVVLGALFDAKPMPGVFNVDNTDFVEEERTDNEIQAIKTFMNFSDHCGDFVTTVCVAFDRKTRNDVVVSLSYKIGRAPFELYLSQLNQFIGGVMTFLLASLPVADNVLSVSNSSIVVKLNTHGSHFGRIIKRRIADYAGWTRMNVELAILRHWFDVEYGVQIWKLTFKVD